MAHALGEGHMEAEGERHFQGDGQEHNEQGNHADVLEIMVGSVNKCMHCGSTKIFRNHVARAVQCKTCRTILEERATSSIEYKALTHVEELHCAVTADFLTNHIVDTNDDQDPYFTRGFITAFRNLSPVIDPVCLVASRTLAGDLADMERIIGDAIYSGYVGYNGRALRPTSTSGSHLAAGNADTRLSIMAYFLILELAKHLEIPKRVSELGVLIFRRVVPKVSMRNRSVDVLATACLVCAVERAKHRADVLIDAEGTYLPHDQIHLPDWKDVVSAAAHPEKEILKYVGLVNRVLVKGVPKPSNTMLSVTKLLCEKLELPESLSKLCQLLLSRISELGLCQRRNRSSILAASLFIATQLDPRTRRTQSDVAKAAKTSEVTLRKVCKELLSHVKEILPEEYHGRWDSRTNRVTASAGNNRDFHGLEDIFGVDGGSLGLPGGILMEDERRKRAKVYGAGAAGTGANSDRRKSVSDHDVQQDPSTTAAAAMSMQNMMMMNPLMMQMMMTMMQQQQQQQQQQSQAAAAGGTTAPTTANPMASFLNTGLMSSFAPPPVPPPLPSKGAKKASLPAPIPSPKRKTTGENQIDGKGEDEDEDEDEDEEKNEKEELPKKRDGRHDDHHDHVAADEHQQHQFETILPSMPSDHKGASGDEKAQSTPKRVSHIAPPLPAPQPPLAPVPPNVFGNMGMMNPMLAMNMNPMLFMMNMNLNNPQFQAQMHEQMQNAMLAAANANAMMAPQPPPAPRSSGKDKEGSKKTIKGNGQKSSKKSGGGGDRDRDESGD